MNGKIDRYELIKEAGQGGFGSVFKGYDARMDRYVAIKMTDGVGRKEAEILSSLDHKGLPRLYDICTADDHTWLVMEWIEGMDLDRYIRSRGAMSEKKAVAIGMEILSVLRYLHGLRPAVIYQDLKPSNIILMPDGHIKLIDLGAAFEMDYGDERLRTTGTNGYAAPEQKGITGIRHAGIRSDIYSWGAVMYSCLSGQLLNRPPYVMEKIRYVCPRISFGLSHVISKSVRRNEKDRYTNTAELIKAMKKSGSVDRLYAVLFAILMIFCIVPFAWAWINAYTDGTFALIQSVIAGKRTCLPADGAAAGDIGYLAVCGAWLFAGIRCVRPGHFMRVNKSVFLSSRRYPGLWIGSLVAGILLGTGMSGFAYPVVSYAEESGVGDAPDASILPVSLVDKNGNRMLVRFDTEYETDGDVCFVIDADTIAEKGDGTVKIEYVAKDGKNGAFRTIGVKTGHKSGEQ